MSGKFVSFYSMVGSKLSTHSCFI